MNKIDINDAKALIQQVQMAHRIAIGFFQRMIPLVDEIAEKLSLDFAWQGPVTTESPKKDKQPSLYWTWDYFPLYNSEHHYEKQHNLNGTTNQADVYLNLTLLLDENFTEEKLKEFEVDDEPDPVSLPIGRALLRAYVYRPTGDSPEKFYDLINRYDSTSVSKEISCFSFEWPLEDVVSSPDEVIEQLSKAIGITMK